MSYDVPPDIGGVKLSGVYISLKAFDDMCALYDIIIDAL